MNAPGELQPLPTRATAEPRTAIGRWMMHGGTPDSGHEQHGHHVMRPWWQVLWLTGVDYFSTLGYQPGIALLAAGALSPLATVILIAVTLLGALPVYRAVAARSYSGQGSIAMLERLLPGWKGKVFVLVLLGFASTDFVITMTLSAADAAAHAVENPYLHHALEGHQVSITIALLAMLAVVFLIGFAEAIGVAMAVAVPYILLNLVVIARCLWEIGSRPELLSRWTSALELKGDPGALFIAAALAFPQLALGLSGFETGVSVMPVVEDDLAPARVRPGAPPVGRIRGTQKLLGTAALIMSVLLLFTSFTTTLLVPEEAYAKGGPAAGRAIAWLAHGLLGSVFGTVYDVWTMLILWFAGSSAMAGMLNLIPRYLPRFGMAPRWVSFSRPLVIVLFAIDVLVTLIFRADVEAQGGAYATGVLALMVSAAVAVALATWSEARKDRRFPRASIYFWIVAVVFGYTLIDNVILRPDGVIISSLFIFAMLSLSGISRWRRATELRVASLAFVDDESKLLWSEVVGKKVSLVPLEHWNEAHRNRKEREIREHYSPKGRFAFLHVELRDDRSEFLSTIRIQVRKEGDNYLIEIANAVAIANTIAYVSELVDPISIFLGLTRKNAMTQAFEYLIFGQGETGILVYQILVRYWEWTPEEDVRPLIFLMSE